MSKQENNMCTEELKAILSLVESNKKKCKENTIPQQSTYSRCTTDGEPHVYFEKNLRFPAPLILQLNTSVSHRTYAIPGNLRSLVENFS
ncbi:hypothetical protein RRG08_036679 [Elysia crispata]|uniref:Uncharacterized protein n=1 Tax=Elysia crispata TaxID=231223 RepID=A0AAE1AES1_9GAST|nr:hypothetical protein RRG08_036679 [Elysia crispata]